jgi:hypothetical protein
MESLRVGNAVTNRTMVDSWSNYYMIDNNFQITADMNVTTFGFYAKRANKVQLIIYRRSGNSFSIVGKSPMVTAKLGANRIMVPHIEAKKGDLVGWFVPSNGVIAFSKGTGGWMIPGFGNTTFFTPMNSGAAAFKYSSNRLYSVTIEGSPASKKEPEIVIADIFYDGIEKTSEGDEYIEIANIGTAPGDISGYRINADDKGQDFTFPEETILQPDASYRVYTNLTDLSTGGFSFGIKKLSGTSMEMLAKSMTRVAISWMSMDTALSRNSELGPSEFTFIVVILRRDDRQKLLES